MKHRLDFGLITIGLLLMLGAKVFAQQPTMVDPALQQDIAEMLRLQRNQAQNDVAVLNAMLARANARIKELEKPAEPPK